MSKIILNKFLIKKNNKGKGIYAVCDFKKGEIIYQLRGKKAHFKDLCFNVKNFKKQICNPLQISRNIYLNLDYFSILFNHSCNPNAGIKNKSTLFALRNIKKGEEITYDYSTTIDESFICKCGSKNCRGAICDFFALPSKIQKYYIKNNAVPNFIKIKYNKINSHSKYFNKYK